MQGERYGGFTIVYPENHSDLVDRKISNFTKQEIEANIVKEYKEQDIKLLNPLWDISFKGEAGEIIGKKEKLEKFFDDKGFTIEDTDVWETYKQILKILQNKQQKKKKKKKEKGSNNDPVDNAVSAVDNAASAVDNEASAVDNEASAVDNEASAVGSTDPELEKAPESKKEQKWEEDGIYSFIPTSPTENNPFSSEELYVYVKKVVQKKYDNDIYYVVFRTDGNIDPKFSLPLFMTEEEWKKYTIGTFSKQDPEGSELKEKTKKFEEYLESEGNAAINAIVNKKRTLGLSRMLVGNINKGGRKTHSNRRKGGRRTRKKRRTIKKRKIIEKQREEYKYIIVY